MEELGRFVVGREGVLIADVVGADGVGATEEEVDGVRVVGGLDDA
ncbi:hypothetical protein [Amycolatopsis plumensis]|uniref:Uncharacterized protein n=1 Tax=Amycolatopsis plumensis TaxID=236508 RepID=A0ABV5U0C1_9PSEU